MKSLHFCKRTLSLVLALIMLVSMATVGIVSTAAAETDAVQTGAEADVAVTGATITGGQVLYLDPTTWDPSSAWFAAYFYSGSGNAWAKCERVEAETSKHIYKVTAPSGSWTNVIFTRMNPANTAFDWAACWNQTGNLTYDGSKNLFTINAWDGQTSGWSSYTEPVEEVITPSGETTTIYFRASSGNEWVTNDDANIFVYTNAGDAVQMDETIDTKTGYAMWSAEIDTAATKIDFYRASFFFDESNANTSTWGHWSTTATAKGEKTCYSISSGSAGSWIENEVTTPNKKDIVNGWYGIWVDSLANQDMNHMLKWHKVDTDEYALYLPSYVNMEAVKVYTSFTSVKITGGNYKTAKTIYKGAPNTLNLSGGTEYTLSNVKRTSGDSEHTYTLNVYHTTDTAALLMNTKVELFRGTVCGTAEYQNNPGIGSADDQGLMGSSAWPSGSGINADNYVSEYKDGIKTKGTYYMYDESGAMVNEDTELAQIKGRGNSSFEASMRVYGKYAYNIKTGEKVALVDGATASKKWSLLANNVDSTMLRNTFIYNVADEIGVPFAPETRICDMYNNGNYLGSYIITEKVEYGKNTIMKKDALGNTIVNLDDEIEDVNMTAYGYDGEDWTDENGYMIEDLMDYVEQVEGDYPAPSGKTYHYSYTDFDRDALKEDLAAGDLKCADTLTAEMIDAMVYLEPTDYKEMNYLLEFELWNRYKNECCWLVCPDTKQAIVCKYPETASQAVMQWVIDEWDAVHTAVYAGDYETYSELIDVDSFAKMYLIQELGINLDAGATSYYVHNVVGEGPEGQSKLYASPVWDYDWSFGSYTGGDSSGTGYRKWVVNSAGTALTVSSGMGNPSQMFVKNKALRTDYNQPSSTYITDHNFQAELAQNENFWADCQRIWTNTMTPVLYDYLDNDTDTDNGADDSVLLAELYPKFKSAALMNEARWRNVNGYLLDAQGNRRQDDNGNYVLKDNWGTKVTSDYTRGSMNFANYYNERNTSGTATKTWDNMVYYLNDWTLTRMNYMSGSNGDLYNEDMAYDIDGVTFEAVFDDATGALKLTPAVETKTLGATELTDEELQYTIYVDGEEVNTQLMSEVPADIMLKPGTHKVYITVSPVAYPTIVEQSENTEKYTFASDGGVVDLTVYFKSSTSHRYIPSVEVGGVKYAMTQTDIFLGKNSSQTQDYYWYEATVPATLGSALSLKFTNSLAMYAEVTVDAVANKAYYFGCQNLNNGKVAVDLTDENEIVRNFYQSATTMLQPDANMAELALTNVNGKTRALGDTDADGKVTIIDATTTQYMLVGLTELGDTEQGLADYDLDGIASIKDVTLVQLNLVAG